MKELRTRAIVLYALGLTPPAAFLESTRRGELRLRLRINHQLANYYERTRELLRGILTRNHGRILHEEYPRRPGPAATRTLLRHHTPHRFLPHGRFPARRRRGSAG
jgi:hypothetical protein